VILRRMKLDLPTPDQALAGRSTAMPVPARHTVLDAPLTGPWPAGAQTVVFGMGCFWGAEKMFWKIPGVISTSVGYAGGITPNPTYEEVCSGYTGHTEAVQVVYDPTQGMRQGNDVGSQYRSAIYTTTDEQLAEASASREAFQPVVNAAGYGAITTEIGKLDTFYYAEDYHQQYLSSQKNPGGYCNHGPNGMTCPVGVARTAS